MNTTLLLPLANHVNYITDSMKTDYLKQQQQQQQNTCNFISYMTMMDNFESTRSLMDVKFYTKLLRLCKWIKNMVLSFFSSSQVIVHPVWWRFFVDSITHYTIKYGCLYIPQNYNIPDPSHQNKYPVFAINDDGLSIVECISIDTKNELFPRNNQPGFEMRPNGGVKFGQPMHYGFFSQWSSIASILYDRMKIMYKTKQEQTDHFQEDGVVLGTTEQRSRKRMRLS